MGLLGDMGTCISTTKVSGSSGWCREQAKGEQHQKKKRANEGGAKKKQGEHKQPKREGREKGGRGRRAGGIVPCGKRTDFGYEKDFGVRYSLGKLLGHGQFGYTYAATDKAAGGRVAVKRIDKSKVLLFSFYMLEGSGNIWFLIEQLLTYI